MALKTVPVGKSLTVRLNNGYEMPLIGFGTANVGWFLVLTPVRSVCVDNDRYIELDTNNKLIFSSIFFTKAYNDEIIRAVGDAIEAGYRHFDGALFYANEVEVGQAIRQKINEKVVTRQELFIVSKVMPLN